MKKVTIYSTPNCHFCNDAKQFFSNNQISYTAIDVSSNLEKRKEMIEKSGQMGVPVITVDEEVIVGFNKAKLASLLTEPKKVISFVMSDPADDTQCESCQ